MNPEKNLHEILKSGFENLVVGAVDKQPSLDEIEQEIKKKSQILLLAGIMATSFSHETAYSEENVSGVEQQLGGGEKSLLENHLGLDVEKLSQTYEVDVQINIGSDGKYIIHLGQQHASLLQEERANENHRNGVIKNQKNIHETLIEWQKDGLESVFYEGFDTGGFSKDRFDLTRNYYIRELVQDLPSGLNKITEDYESAIKSLESGKQNKLPETIAIRKLLIDIGGDQNASARMKEDAGIYETFQTLLDYSDNRALDSILYFGAVQKLYTEGSLDVEHTESANDPNRALAIVAAERLRNIQGEVEKILSKGELEEGDQVRSKELIEEIQHQMDVFRKYGLEPREDYVIQSIASNSNDSSNINYIPLIYGEAHNFKNNVSNHNKTNEDTTNDFGLIKLTQTKQD